MKFSLLENLLLLRKHGDRIFFIIEYPTHFTKIHFSFISSFSFSLQFYEIKFISLLAQLIAWNKFVKIDYQVTLCWLI